MAIYQFKLNLIPEKGVKDKFGFIPDKLDIDFEERTEHFYLKEEDLLESSDFFKDALTINFWESVNILPTEMIYYINKLFPRRCEKNPDSYFWKHYTKTVDNDSLLIINKTTEKIEQIYFRADLREEGLVFLNQFINVAKKYDCLLMDTKGNLVKPDKNKVYKLVMLSNAYKFLVDPEKFLDGLNK